jgi:2,4-dienoyl-CoA reductase-like NADH-dependent reductase (Old Yellow Enzyme family)
MKFLDKSSKINKLELKNRLVMPPMANEKSDNNGKVTDELCKYYNEKSNGGYIGLIITEHSYISPEGRASKGQLSISEASDIEGLKKIVSIIHNNDTKVIAQINHAGAAARPENQLIKPLGASAVKFPNANRDINLPIEMNNTNIKKIISDFTASAVIAQKAGYDGVEIHSAHGYLLNQFFSPLTNKRSDEYNGSTLDGRIKLHLDIIKSVRKAVGPNYPIALRLGACDYIDGGITIEDSIYAARKFENAGLDLLDISGGFNYYSNPNSQKEGYFSELSAAIKAQVNIPVILTGGVITSNAAENLLKDNKADLIGVGRAILKDSNWAKNAFEK